MAVIAVRLNGVSCCWSFPAQDVDSRRNVINMNRVHTSSITAKMISVMAFRNPMNKHSKGNVMSVKVGAVELKPTITLGAMLGCPEPARDTAKRHGRIDSHFTEKAGKKFSIYWNSARIVNGHDLKLPFSLCLGDVRLQPCGAFSF